MYCSYCGKELTEGSSYCKRCGVSIPEETLLEIEKGKRQVVSQRVLSSIRNVAEAVGIQDISAKESQASKTDSASENANTMEKTRTTLTTGCKVWFWIMLIANTFLVLSLTFVSSSPLSYMLPSSGLASLSFVANAIGAGFILFARRKLGFYIVVTGAVIALIFNLSSGVNFVSALLGGIINPLICYYFVNKNADVLV